MEKDYGIEYEREVLAAFDRMAKKYENHEEPSGQPSAEAEKSLDDKTTRVFSKEQEESLNEMLEGLPREGQEEEKAEGAAALAAFSAALSEEEKAAEPQGRALGEAGPEQAADQGEKAASKESSEAKAENNEESASSGVPAAAAASAAAVSAAADGKKMKKDLKSKKDTKEKKNKDAKKASAEKTGNGKPAQKKKRRRHKFWGLKILLWLFLLCIVAGIGAAGYVGYKVLDIIRDTPEINPDNIYDLLGENSVLVDCNGEFLENIYSGDALRTNIEYRDLPKDLINAFVCTEDKTFWEHHGFNFVRIIGAVVQNLTGESDRIGGTSTITQQLARNLYLSDVKGERSMERKIREAYYTVVIENSLTKEQILEAYLNTVYMGYNSNGIAAAAEAYFSKDVEELSLVECAALAALPQSPNTYAPIKRIAVSAVEDPDSLDIISKDENWIIYFNDASKDRINLVLYNMHDQGKIDDRTWTRAKSENIRKYINPGTNATTYSKYSYFVDYVKDKVLDDIQSYLGYTHEEATRLLYQGGLTIHSTLNTQIQDILQEVYDNEDNFPDVGSLRKDKAGNILYQEGSKILLYSKANMLSDEGDFTLKPDEIKWLDNGDLQIFKGNRLNIYNTTVGDKTDYSVELKGFFEIENKKFYSISGGSISIGSQYKTRNSDGDVIIASGFFDAKPDAFTKNKDGSVTINHEYITLNQRILQPQSAMTIMDHTTSQLVAMIGGRGIEGKLLYNRATAPRQPGSSIKPLAVYSTALQAGADGLGNFTAAMPLDDAPTKRGNGVWPKNWYSGYRGMTNLRHAVEQSINACAVQLYLQLDPQMCIDQLQGMGVTSLVTTGTANDMNAAALALGGMTHGISPLEMTGAYGTFGNYGTYSEPIVYTTITNKRGDVIIEKKPVTHQVMSEAAASLMTDILRTTVTNGLASAAKMKSSETAGKTGTTSEKYDIWFCGLTPKYAAAVWIGNDVNIPLRQGSSHAVQLWKKVMDPVCSLDGDYKKFEMKGEFVRMTVDRYSGKKLGSLSGLDSRGSGISEIFIAGTEPTETDDSHVLVNVCAETGYLATPYCDNVIQKVGIVRPCGSSWEKFIVDTGMRASIGLLPDARYDAPDFYCPVHNPDRSQYPVSPIGSGIAAYNPMDVNPEPEPTEEPTEITDPTDPEGSEGTGRGENPGEVTPPEGTVEPGQTGEVTPPEGGTQPAQPSEGATQPGQTEDPRGQQPSEGTTEPGQPSEGQQPSEGTTEPSQPSEGTTEPTQPSEGQQPSEGRGEAPTDPGNNGSTGEWTQVPDEPNENVQKDDNGEVIHNW
ncbi:MAG: transglycosylase domain-containing protein [Firmicutes bacterium]|nr:transglycosylase domain-containing protein [Bacillota bacterium]